MEFLRPIDKFPSQKLEQIKVILTDVDDTLTHSGSISGQTLDAMERLRDAGLRIVPVTAASSGWCSLMAHMWPVDAVIGENGGVCLSRNQGRIERRLWSDAPNLSEELRSLGNTLRSEFPFLEPAEDSDYRGASLSFVRRKDPNENLAVVSRLKELGASATLNSFWIIGWFGGYDKLVAARRWMDTVFGFDVDAENDICVFTGDSENDEPMFKFFHHSIGVSTVTQHRLIHWPKWITVGPGGEGFVEVANLIIGSKERLIP